jgi:CheY-like chemotaxis protein
MAEKTGVVPTMKKVVLIADDDVAVRTMLGRFLESEGFNVVFASNGRQAISEFLIMPYDLIMLDLMMPGADGWEVFNALSKLHPMMPIIIMTALPHQQEHAERAGVDALLEKPLDLPFLLETIHQVMARHEPVRVARRGAGALASHPATGDAPQFLADV